MISLRYPLEVNRDNMDYMVLQTYDYVSRGLGDGVNRGDSPPEKTFILPIPELPLMISQQKYGQISGAMNNALATGLGTAYGQIDQAITNGTADTMDLGAVAAQLRSQVGDQGGPIVREQAARFAGAIAEINSGMFQSLASGEISNPNVELLYNGPTLRSYSMNWTFAPKSPAEARACFEIVKELKKSHLPSGTSGGGGMLKVPSYFTIRLVVNGEEANFYQKFFPCFLEAISIKQDTTGNHMTLPNGEPAVSSMSLVFKEIKTLVSSDFDDGI